MTDYAIKLSEFPAWTIRANRATRFTWWIVAVDGDTIRISMTGSLEDYEDAMERAGQLVLEDHPEPREVAAVDAALREVLTDTDRFWMRWSAFCEARDADRTRAPNTWVVVLTRRSCAFEASVFPLRQDRGRGVLAGAHIFHGTLTQCADFARGYRCIGVYREACDRNDLFDVECRFGRRMDEMEAP